VTRPALFITFQPTIARYALWLFVCLMLVPDALYAQPFYFGNENPRKTTAVSASFSTIDFEYNGDTAPPFLLEFSEPAYGLTFSRSNFFASVMWGTQNASDTTETDLSLVDFSLFAWSELFFSAEAKTAEKRFFLPISLFSSFRRVSPRSSNAALDEFNIATLGLGLGVGYYAKFNETFTAEFRSIPAIGYAAQSFGESSGISTLIDTDLQFHFASVFNSVGLSFGYSLRIQSWNIRAASVFGSVSRDLYDYKSFGHTFSVGANF